MTDTREDILARLLEVVASIPTMKTAYRNNEDISETDLPAAIVFDGNEETGDASDKSQRPANRPTKVDMMPSVVILHRDPNHDFAMLRRELIKRVLNDAELSQLAKTFRNGNGAIRYLGCRVGHAWLRNLHGAMTAQFLFSYTLRPDEL